MIYELFSRRNRDKTKDPDVYIYDNIPISFRNQFKCIVLDVCRELEISFPNAITFVCERFAREKGLDGIYSTCIFNENTWDAFDEYVSDCSDTDFIDLMEFVFVVLVYNRKVRNQVNYNSAVFTNAIEELNERFKQHNLGYEFSNGMIIKKTNKVTHETIVKPALKLLCDEDFRGAEEEYLNAWKQFMDGDNQGAILNAAKAFESFMKILCTKLGYSFEQDKITASGLLALLKSKHFYPDYLNDHLDNLNKVLLNGAPTVRNKTAGHGQGEECRIVPDDYATYVMNLVASNIVFLHSIYKEHHSGK